MSRPGARKSGASNSRATRGTMMTSTAAIFATDPNFDAARAWLSMLVFFDAIFVTMALWVFAPVMNE